MPENTIFFHPSQNLTPNDPDLMLNEKLVEVGKLLNVQVLDHLILAKYRYYSFKDEAVREMVYRIMFKINR